MVTGFIGAIAHKKRKNINVARISSMHQTAKSNLYIYANLRFNFRLKKTEENEQKRKKKNARKV